MNLVIDVGNTHTKVAVFEAKEIQFQERGAVLSLAATLAGVLNRYPVTDAFISQVAPLPEAATAMLSERCRLYFLSHRSKLPFSNRYATPETWGADRMALVSAASCRFPAKNALVIDAGTCITYDFLNSANEYLGGAISPGIRLRYQALHTFTAHLPLVETEDFPGFMGNSTTTSIHAGVVNGTTCEIEGMIAQYEKKYGDVQVILTGGDAPFLAKRLKSSIFVSPNFMMEGLNVVLELNKNR